jgi:ribonuclease-3
MHADSEALQAELGYRFRDQELLRRALTHKSRAREDGLPEVVSENEQLEFLGDSVLGFLASEWLVALHPDWTEGRLSIRKSHLVSAKHLHQVAQTLHLGDYLRLGRGEEISGGRQKSGLLADALEAVIAATYLDGGIDPARRLVVERILTGFDASLAEGNIGADAKSALEEIARQLNLPRPRYIVVGERGPDHAKTFIVEARIGEDWSGQAEGFSKKSAGNNAARLVLQQLQSKTESGGRG